MNKNHRQPYAVSALAGADTSAKSWGTGRAVSRIPRVAGGGTHRAGQGAFGNMCRKGRMFAPTKIWRKWHVKVPKNQKRYATCSALAASAVAPLVMAKGHRIGKTPECPLVIADKEIEVIRKTKVAKQLLEALGLADELERVVKSRHIRAGKGKARNRRYVQALGPLIVHDKPDRKTNSIEHSFRNIPGVEFAHVERLNLLRLAPGGVGGRLIIWTESAFKKLNRIFGTRKTPSKQKKGYQPPRSVLTNCDISRIINSPEIQAQLRDKRRPTRQIAKKNPLKNKARLHALNPYAHEQKRRIHLRDKLRRFRSAEEKSRDRALKRARKRLEHTKNPRTEFKKLLLSPAIAPVRGPLEIGILSGQK